VKPLELPPDGTVLLVTEGAGEWGAEVADRNAQGLRTALLVVSPDSGDPSTLPEEMAAEMAADVFRGAPWQLVDARAGIPEQT